MNFTETQKEKALKLSKKLSSEFNEEETEEFAKKHTKEAWYHYFSETYRKKYKIETIDALKLEIWTKKTSVYTMDKQCQKPILHFVGIGTGENKVGPKKKSILLKG